MALTVGNDSPGSRLSTTRKVGSTKRTTPGKLITAIKRVSSTTKKGKTVKTTRAVTLKKKPKSTTKSLAKAVKGKRTSTRPLSSTTPFDYPDIVENVTLPEGMFEVESVEDEVDSDEDGGSELADLVIVPSSTQKNTPKSRVPQKKVRKTTTKSLKPNNNQRPSSFPGKTTRVTKDIKQ